MIRSMTGYGSAETGCDQWVVRAEARSVNHRELQISFRLPDFLQMKEFELQKLFENKVHRGHLYLSLTCRPRSRDATVLMDEGALRAYIGALKDLAASADVPFAVDLATLLRLPGTLRNMTADEDLKDTLWPQVVETAEAAIDALVEMRGVEGANLSSQLQDLCSSIERLTDAIDGAQSTFVAAYRDRLKDRVGKLLQGTDVAVNEDSLAREVAIHADRSDVSEEIARLRSHVQQFRQALDSDGEPVGRKMVFLGQEMLREAGTIAAKVPAGSHVAQVLELRGEVERLREQVRNVE